MTLGFLTRVSGRFLMVLVSLELRRQVRAQESLDHLSSVCRSRHSRIQTIHPWVLHVLGLRLAVVAPLVSVSSSPCPLVVRVADVVPARRTVSLVHDVYAHDSWSDTERNSRCSGGCLCAHPPVTTWRWVVRVPTGTRRVKGGVPGPAEDLRPVSEVEAGQFSAGRRCTGAGCRLTSQEATRHRFQAAKGRCGHTFPPPGGSWCPIRVTWTRVGHQAIDGLDEGVWNRRGFGC